MLLILGLAVGAIAGFVAGLMYAKKVKKALSDNIDA